MVISFSEFLSHVTSNPVLAIIVLLSLGSILVNGATDAVNAIATAISTRSLKPEHALPLASAGNFLGLALMTLVSTAVANTIFHMVNFGGDNHQALVALCAALVAILVWTCASWALGIPTSESHALIAGVTGAAIALQNGLAGINWSEWVKVLYGLGLSLFLGFFLGWILSKGIGVLCARQDRRKMNKLFDKGQVLTAFTLAFMHGAQDGQKFMSITMLGILLASGAGSDTAGLAFPLWLMVVCSLLMAFGTAIGGKRIIKSVAIDMVKMERYQGFAASLAGTLSLLVATFTGLPVSTTHVNTTAIMGVGAERNIKKVKWGFVKEMLLTWVFTFPGCGLIGFVLAKIFGLLF